MSSALRSGRLGFLAVCASGIVACGADVPDEPVVATVRNPEVPAIQDDLVPSESVADTQIAISALEVAYGESEDRNHVGYFAAPEQITEPLPGIVLIHERWGLDESMRAIASDLARAGFAVMAVDLFAGRTAEDPEAAQSLSSETNVNRDAAVSNIAQAVDYLRAYALAPRVAVVGFGLGGGLALDTAVTVPEKIDAVASHYGPLLLDEEGLERLRAPFLGLFAENDASVPVREVQAFRNLLRDAGNPGMVLIHSGTSHGFADRGRPAFNAAAADEAREELTRFLATAISDEGGQG